MRSTVRKMLIATVIITVIALLISIFTIPFLFESPSMFYKFGWKKTLLRSGKIIGLTAAFLLLLQLPQAARIKWLDRLFSLPLLYTLHRYSAYGIMALVILHPIAVFVPDGILMIPFEVRYWPEWVGAALLVIVVAQFVLSNWRLKFFSAYQNWLLLHRIMGAVAIVLLFVHVLYVSETFEHAGLPRTLTLASAMVVLALWLWVRLQSAPFRKRALIVKEVAPAGEDAFAIDLVPNGWERMEYIPGQFAFISFHSDKISKESHPFTISSSPSRPDTIQFTIRCCGDWTRQVHTLRPGDKAYIQGPYGRFGHLFASGRSEIIMIAGGIGITPMMSMLRYMCDVTDPKRSILIWSNKTLQHIFNEDELKAMEKKLTNLTWIPILTREKGERGLSGRLDLKKLESLLQSYRRDAIVYLCGPPPMIKQVRSDLIRLGFSKDAIHFEAFGF